MCRVMVNLENDPTCNVFAECESNNMVAARKLYLSLCVMLLSNEILC
jgi:hypothetical protein